MRTLVHSAVRIDAGGTVEDAWVLLDDARIAAVGVDRATAPDAEVEVDAGGARMTPGFIDIHGHGGGGTAYDEGADELVHALAAHRRHGTTRSVASLVAAPIPDLQRQLGVVADRVEHDPLLLGAHLEGPYLSPDRRGAHDPSALQTPRAHDVDALLAAARGTLRMVTVAPELPGALEAIARFAAAGVVPAVGHTTADDALAHAAFDAGARVLTHAFNAMNGIHHRAPGPIGAAVADERITLELVLDGHHVDPEAARILVRAAPGRVALITDAMAAASAAEGEYRLGSLDVTVRDGLAVLTGTDSIAGSTLTQDTALRLAVDAVGMDPADAVAALTLVPARALGLDDRLGRLAPGYAADVVLLDDAWEVERVWADGVEITAA